jgi:hypothetical protein
MPKVDDPECESETRLVALVCMYLSLALGEKVLPRRDAQKTQHTPLTKLVFAIQLERTNKTLEYKRCVSVATRATHAPRINSH